MIQRLFIINGYRNPEYHSCNSAFLLICHAALDKLMNCSVSFPPSIAGIINNFFYSLAIVKVKKILFAVPFKGVKYYRLL